LGVPAISTVSLEEALDEAELLSEEKTIILVTGSIFVAAAARSVWQERASEKDSTYIGR